MRAAVRLLSSWPSALKKSRGLSTATMSRKPASSEVFDALRGAQVAVTASIVNCGQVVN